MKYFAFAMIILLLLTSCADFPTSSRRKKVNVSGYVVETYFPDTNTIFSVRGVHLAAITFGGEVIAVTNPRGKYQLFIPRDGDVTLRAEKEGYFFAKRDFILRKDEHRIMDFWLEREDEECHGWSAFSEGLTLGQIQITPNGLTLIVGAREPSHGGREHLYATKLIELPNHATYTFTAKVNKDIMSDYIFFEALPLITGHRGQRHTWTIDKWQLCSVTVEVNDTTVIGTENIYDEEGDIVGIKEIYPPMVDIVLKIGVGGGTRSPQGYFNNIRVTKE